VIIRAGAPVVIRVAERDRRYVALDFDVESSGTRDRPAPPRDRTPLSRLIQTSVAPLSRG
jgi:hypothetical protein